MEKVPMTKAGFEALESELRNLKSVERPAVIQAIAEARAHGDLSENAEYSAARERQSFIEGRIQELEGVVSHAQIIEHKSFTGPSIKFGATVTIIDEDTEEERVLQIVGEYESDADNGRISITSPVARALIGKNQGDSVEVRTPKGLVSYEVEKVAYV